MTFPKWDKALIVGAGPSLVRNLQEFRDSDWEGPLFATDRALEICLKEGVIPEYVVTLEEEIANERYFKADIIRDFGNMVQGLYSIKTPMNVQKQMRKIGLREPSAVGTGTQIHTTSNCGLFIMMILSHDFKCNDVYMIGMDHSFARDTKFEDTHKECKYIENPYDKVKYIAHPLHEHWKYNFIDRMGMYKEVKVTNCTGRGILFGGRIIWKDSIK